MFGNQLPEDRSLSGAVSISLILWCRMSLAAIVAFRDHGSMVCVAVAEKHDLSPDSCYRLICRQPSLSHRGQDIREIIWLCLLSSEEIIRSDNWQFQIPCPCEEKHALAKKNIPTAEQNRHFLKIISQDDSTKYLKQLLLIYVQSNSLPVK